MADYSLSGPKDPEIVASNSDNLTKGVPYGSAGHFMKRVPLLRPDLCPHLSAATGFEKATLKVPQAQAGGEAVADC